MNPVQYLIADHTLDMSPGKLAAQVAHASVEGLRLNARTEWGNPWDASIVNRWYQGGHYAKIVLQADDLTVAKSYLADRGFESVLIIDEGRTEFGGGLTPTVLGCPVVDKDQPHVRETFGAFKLYSGKPKIVVLECGDQVNPEVFEKVKEAGASGDLEKAKSILMFNERPQRRRWSRWFDTD